MSDYSPVKVSGFKAIDQDHRSLFDLINKLMQDDPDQQDLFDIIKALHAYAAEHFDREFQLMVACDFPAEMKQEHLLDHARFSNRISQFTDLINSDSSRAVTELDKLVQAAKAEAGIDQVDHASPARQIAAYLTQWLIRHTNQMDQKLFDFIKQTGFDASKVNF
ncbi:MAG: hypothetical protein HQL54_08745 [Magnetococcales bacterium]|nr:hypothetical protein [Magnetococcales bacterium]